jgi:hypothetical protein
VTARDLWFSLLGCVFEIRRSPAAVWRAIQDRLPPVETAGPVALALRRYSIVADGEGFIVTRARRHPSLALSVASAADLVVDDVEVALSRAVDGRILVHAGAVGWRGRAVLVPGRSGSGKSELVAALVRAGAVYLSDEFAVLDREGKVHPYRRPVALRRPSGTSRVAVETNACAMEPLPVGGIAFLRYRSATDWRPRPISSGAALLGLLQNTLSCRFRLDDARRILRRVVASAPAIAGDRPDADDVATVLLDESFRGERL